MTLYTCPDGHNLKGTLEHIEGIAEINGDVEDPHDPEYGGYTDVDWNSQYTVRRHDPDTGALQIVWICDNGDSFLAGQLVTLTADEAA